MEKRIVREVETGYKTEDAVERQIRSAKTEIGTQFEYTNTCINISG
jgi:hypothetical protein